MRKSVAKKIISSTIFMDYVKNNITKLNSASNKSVKPSYKVWQNKMNLFVKSVKMQGRRLKIASRVKAV